VRCWIERAHNERPEPRSLVAIVGTFDACFLPVYERFDAMRIFARIYNQRFQESRKDLHEFASIKLAIRHYRDWYGGKPVVTIDDCGSSVAMRYPGFAVFIYSE
jgi:hypothetical protein